jgi:hypothetical protein
MRVGDWKLRFFGGRDGCDERVTIKSENYLSTLELMGREWTAHTSRGELRAFGGLTYVPVLNPDPEWHVHPSVPLARHRRPERRQYRYG